MDMSGPRSLETPSTLDESMIQLQLINYDFYMCKPNCLLDSTHGTSLPLHTYQQVPVIRIYGSLPSGHQVLCHIHSVFPYFFVKYDGSVEKDNANVINQKCAQLHSALEEAMLSSIKRENKTANSKQLNFIADVSVVKGIPFYGYHIGWNLFYKISILNPSYINRVTDIFRKGLVTNGNSEIFESHIPYLLQFTADFNLFGCEWITLNKCYFRKPVLNNILAMDELMLNDQLSTFLNTFCNDSNILDQNNFKRIGNGLLEIDILPQFIQNRDKLQNRNLHHDFIEKLGSDPEALNVNLYVNSTKQMAKDIENQRDILGLKKYIKKPDIIRKDTMNDNNGWAFSSDNLKSLAAAVKRTKSFFNGTPLFENYVPDQSQYFDKIPSPADHIPLLWPSEPTNLNKSNIRDPQEVDTNQETEASYTSTQDDQWDHSSENEVDLTEDNYKPPQETNVEENTDSPSNDFLVSENTSSLPKFSLDFQLTQRMAKKRQNVEQFPINSNLISPKKTPRFLKETKSTFPVNEDPDSRIVSYSYKKPKLTFSNILKDINDKGFPIMDYKDPYFSNPVDLENKPYIFAGKKFDITSTHLSDRIPVMLNNKSVLLETKIQSDFFSSWRYLRKPPSFNDIKKSDKALKKKQYQSQIVNEFQTNSFLYKFGSGQSLKKKAAKVHDSLTHMSLEIHVNVENDMRPDPSKDEVKMIFWCIEDDTYPFDLGMKYEGVLAINEDLTDLSCTNKIEKAASPLTVAFYETEFDMFIALTDLVLLFDPDILSGFEVHMSSWGYIIDRCKKAHKLNFIEEIARVECSKGNTTRDTWGFANSSGISVTGRHVLNIWRLMRSSFNLTQYTIENLAYHVLHERLPHFSFKTLSEMWSKNSGISTLRTVIYYWISRMKVNISLLKKDDFISKTAEMSRLLGVDFNSVFYRGSQYKVESFLIRICKSESFVLIAPSKNDVKNQRALECIPMVMEPEPAFYKSPMVVLDFQSLYPSIMMAYNYCYSTMLGPVKELNLKGVRIGVTKIPLRPDLLDLLKEDINISPNGIAFVKENIRKSTLSKMLNEILDLRVMVKNTISELDHDNESLKRRLNNQQLALKLLANVTYGYTSASFSGRMPCSELSDSIVQTGREILENSIEFIESNVEWGAKVAYGDTDSLFVYLPGRSKEDAFKIGKDISEKISERNLNPIYLKFEKVYHPCILVSKKRYVGYSYEFMDQKTPNFDSKGIETVRRDGHPAQQKIIEKSLKVLFDTKDLSQVKHYLQEQFRKIYKNKVSIQDFCFAKEVRLGSYKSEKTAPAGAVVAIRQMETDTRNAPQYKERVPYLVVKAKSGEILRNRSLSPLEFISSPDLELDADYYVTKTLIPPLSRLLNVMGINVAEWTYDLTRYSKHRNIVEKKGIYNVTNLKQCINCGNDSVKEIGSNLCNNCLENPRKTAVSLLTDNLNREDTMNKINTTCRVCSYRYSNDASPVGDIIAQKCESFDCPVYYSRIKANKYMVNRESQAKNEALEFIDHW